METHVVSPGSPRRILPSRAFLCLLAIFAATVWPHILRGTRHCEGDERNYYYPTIKAMSIDWPRIAPPTWSAAAPLYVYLLAALPSSIVENLTVLKLVSSLLSVGLLWIVYHFAVAACRSEWVAFLLTLPILCSQSFQICAIWLMTDNVALLFLVPALFYPFLCPRPHLPAALGTTLCAALATATRQIYVWVSLPLAGFYLLWVPLGVSPLAHKGDSEQSYRYLVPAILALVGPLGVLGWLVSIWGGLAPGNWQVAHPEVSFAAIPFSLSMLGGYALAYASVIRPDWKMLTLSRLTIPVVVAGCALALIPDDFNEEVGRTQGLMWRFVQAAPSLHHRSLLLLALAPVGALTLLYFYLQACNQEDRLRINVFYFGLLLWFLAQVRNPNSFQRYYEVFLLVCLAMLAARYGTVARLRPSHWIGPVAASGINLLLSHLRFLELV